MRAYLTVDDAPSATLPEKLDVLAAHDAPALFFCEGSRLDERPDHARLAVEAGHHLGNHAYTHEHASEMAVEAFEREVDRTETLIDEVYDRTAVSRPARTFRFPYGDDGGDRADRFQRVLETRGFAPPRPDGLDGDGAPTGGHDWGWTFSVEDWTVESADRLRDRVDAAADRSDPAADQLVLFHDAGNDPSLFDAFVERLGDAGFAFADPIELVRE